MADFEPIPLKMKMADPQVVTDLMVAAVRDWPWSRNVMTAVDAAQFLSGKVGVIAGREDAGTCFQDVKRAVDDITRAINRPMPARALGPCPTWVGGTHDKDCDKTHPHQCTTALTAKPGMEEVVCPHCHITHNVEDLLEKQLKATDDKSFTMSELWKLILPVMRLYVPLRTLQDWAARGKIIPTGYDPAGKPKFQLRDVRELWEARPQHGSTGATAHKTRDAG